MIVQITRTKNELFLLKEMLPVWQNYADAFVFFDDNSEDGTYDFLMENRTKYNILNVLRNTQSADEVKMESTERQKLFDEAFKHSGNIICLDTDEYLDGFITKDQLEDVLEKNKNTLLYCPWIQYTGKNQVRVDGPWRNNFKDRIGSYSEQGQFKVAQMHSEHLPHPGKQGVINSPGLFIAHLQWLDKPTVAVKQYFWKIEDYVNNLKFGVEVTPASAYDESVANFEWEYIDFDFDLKVDPEIYSKQNLEESYKYKFIRENVEKYNIPNLNDWGLNIHGDIIYGT